MAQEFSFDVVCKVDLQAVDNAVNAANREIGTRFDFKGSVSKVTLDKTEAVITIHSDDEAKLKSVIDILMSKAVRQGIALNAFQEQKLEAAEQSTVRQKMTIAQGIPTEKIKEITKSVKAAKIKVTVSQQKDHLRVSGRSKDDLQKTMTHIQTMDVGVPIQFTNYR